MPKIIHYRTKCIGCGICFEIQPDVWRMSTKDGKATLVNAIQKKEIYQLEENANNTRGLQEVIDACPVKIISVV